MREIPDVTERPAGKIPTTTVTNELTRAVQAMAPMLGGGQVPGHWSGPGFDVWLVWDSGPAGEANKTNHQYWLRQAFVSNVKADPPATTDPAKFTEITVEPKYETWILATNLSERPAGFTGTEADGSHGLAKGTAIGPIWTEHDSADPGVTRYVFQGPPLSYTTFRVDLTQTGGTAGTKTTAVSFTYTVKVKAGTTELGTAKAPEWPSRSENGKKVAATKGLAYYDENGAVQIAIAFEPSGTGGCA